MTVSEEDIMDRLRSVRSVYSVRHQPPYYVITVEHPPLDDEVVLEEIEQMRDREHSGVVEDLPSWAEVKFKNALEIFLKVDT